MGGLSEEAEPEGRTEGAIQAEGKTGCMVYVDSEGSGVSPLYLKDLQNPETDKIPPRLVNIYSDKFTSIVESILNAITSED